MLVEQSSHITRSDLPVWEYPNGQQLTLPIFKIKGTGNGRSAYIQANVHGAEVQGNAVIYQLLKYFAEHPPKGDVVLVPHANPFAKTQKGGEHTNGRNCPTTGQNWNRHYVELTCRNEQKRSFPEQVNLESFAERHVESPWEEIQRNFRAALRIALKSYRERRVGEGLSPAEQAALPLLTLALEADSVLDLHTSPVGTHYAYVPEYAAESACYLGVPYVLLIPNAFDGALDEATFTPWWGLQEALTSKGRLKTHVDFESYTLEFGGQAEINLDAAHNEARGLLSYLCYRGTISGYQGRPPRDCLGCRLENYRSIYSDGGGLVDFHAACGQHVEKGEGLASILNLHRVRSGDEVDSAVRKVCAPENGVILLRYPSASVHSGTVLYKMMTKVGTLQPK